MTTLASLALPSSPSSGLFSLLWRRRGRFLLVFSSIFALTIVALVFLPKSYFASGSVMVAGPEPLPGQSASQDGAAAIWQARIGDPADLDSNMLEIRAPRLLRMIIETPEGINAIKSECEYQAQRGLSGVMIAELKSRLPSAIGQYLPERHVCAELESNDLLRLNWVDMHYSVVVVGRSRVIAIGYASRLPEVSMAMTNLLINTYLSDEREKRVASRDTGISWLRQEITRLHDSLDRDTEQIQSFRRSHGLLMGRFSTVTSEQLTELMETIAKAEADQALALSQVRELEGGNYADLPAILDSRTIEDLKRQANEVTAQLAGVSQKYGSTNDVTGPLKSQLASIQSRLNTEMDHVKSSLRRNLMMRGEQVVALKAELAAAKTRASQASDDESKIASLVRDVDVKREMYITLSRRANELSTEREVLGASSQLISLAEFPLHPSFPKPIPFIVGGFTLASILGGLTALRRKSVDQSMNPDVLDDLIGNLPVMANIPMISLSLLERRHRAALPKLLEQMAQPSLLQEAVRRVYAQIRLANSPPIHTLLITSSQTEEGKSLLTMGLAQFAAKNGKRVLIIEGDLRRPTMAKTLNAKHITYGLSDYLAGTVIDIPVTHMTDLMDVIYAGQPSYASTELLANDRLLHLLTVISGAYDLILIDSPPCDILMDAQVIASQVDGVIYCVRHGSVESVEKLARNLANLRSSGSRMLGFVVACAPPSLQPAYYSIKRLT